MKLRDVPRPPLAVAAVVVTALAVALVGVGVRSGTSSAPPSTTAPPDPRGEVLVPADKDPGVNRPELAERCAVWTEPLWRTMRLNRYVTDATLEETQRFLDLVAEAHQGCQGDDYDTVVTTAQAWLHRAGPTYATDEPATLSRRCADALAPVRAQLRAVGPYVGRGMTPELAGSLDAAARVLGTDACTSAEAVLFTAAELEPARRRAQARPPSGEEAAAGPQPAAPFVDKVRRVERQAALSERCSLALGPARDVLARAVGDSMGVTSLEQLQRRVTAAAASGACTAAEVDDFQAVELGPALGQGTAPQAPR